MIMYIHGPKRYVRSKGMIAGIMGDTEEVIGAGEFC